MKHPTKPNKSKTRQVCEASGAFAADLPETKNPAARVKTTDTAAGRFKFPVVKKTVSILGSTRQKGGRCVSSI